MKTLVIFLVKLSPAARPPALAAAHEAFPGAEVREMSTLELVNAAGSTSRPDLVVLGDPDASLVAQAVQAVGPDGRPRWAVVILGSGSSDLAETVPPEEWQPRSLARIFRAVLLQHELLCENLRLRGDLKTVARRISHDLRTPVGCVYTSADLLGEMPLGDTALLAGLAETFKQSSGDISRIIERASFVLKASVEPLPATAVGMDTVLAAVLRELEPELAQAGAEVALPASWPATAGVAPWLHVIWVNLLRNALQHGGPATRAKIGWEMVADGYRFSLTDRGRGIAPARQAALFVPFEQLHTVRTAGLGLSVVQRLVTLQGGHCDYVPAPESGACFRFTLLPARATATSVG